MGERGYVIGVADGFPDALGVQRMFVEHSISTLPPPPPVLQIIFVRVAYQKQHAVRMGGRDVVARSPF